MKKQLNKIVATMLTGVMAISVLPLSSFAAMGTDGIKGTKLSISQEVALYQDGALSEAYAEGEWTEQYTDPEEGTIEYDLYQGMLNVEKEIEFDLDSYMVSVSEAQESFRKVINSNPDLFYVSNIPIIYYYTSPWCNDCGGGGFIFPEKDGTWTDKYGDPCDHNESHNWYYVAASCEPTYIADKSKIAAMKSKFNAAVERALAGINDDMTDLDKALYCHDYIIKLNSYDYENFVNNTVPNVSHSAYGALVLNVSVCDGYSLAYSYLLKKCGINTRLVTSVKLAHAWNAVELDDEWYFVDCTGDDAVTNYTNNANFSDRFDVVSHNTFLMSEELIRNTEFSVEEDDEEGETPILYDGWAQTDIIADNTQYDNAYWRDITNEYGYCDKYWYYLDDATYEIMKTEDPTQAGKVYSSKIKDASNSWLVGENSFWTGSYGKASVHTPSKTMYVSVADKIYAFDLTKEEPTDVEYYKHTGNGYIYGLTVIDDNLYIGIANAPNEKETLTSKFLGEVRLGDVNGDNKINATDALGVLSYAAGIREPGFITSAADVNKDTKINSFDALEILSYAAGL